VSVAGAVRRVLPAPLRQRLRRAMFEWLSLTWTTASGINLRVANYNEWIIYNEIFVDGEYDAAIAEALAARSGNRPFHVIDLGANVGFFTLRVFDRLRASGNSADECRALAVDANPATIPPLRARLHQDNPFADRVRIVEGLVGRPSGSAVIYPSLESPGDSSTRRPEQRVGVAAAFVDLDRLAEDAPVVDLLKCDVEGSELLFLEHYADLLRKTAVVVIELHEDLCPIDLCRPLIRAAGFSQETILRERGGCALYLYARRADSSG
jgi:FkbM family methyltransferase